MSKPTVILCPGVFHVNFHIQPSITWFEQAGYKIVPLPLLSTGQETSADDTVNHIRDATLTSLNAGEDVCLILHSAAGAFGTEAINRTLFHLSTNPAPGKIIRIVYLGTSFDHQAVMAHALSSSIFTIDMERKILSANRPYESFYHDMTQEAAQPFVEALTWQHLVRSEVSSEAWKQIPATLVVCELDQTVPPALQEETGREYNMPLKRINAGHVPFVSKPEEVVRAIKEILEGQDS